MFHCTSLTHRIGASPPAFITHPTMSTSTAQRSQASTAPKVPSRQRGQGMTEYLIVVALISVAAIGVYSFFGQTLRNQTAGIALELSGQDASTAVNQAQTAASQAQTLAGQRRGLENYGSGNR